MNVTRRTLGFVPAGTPTVEAHCNTCGDTYRTLLGDNGEARRAHIHHECAVGVRGAVWTLTIPPAVVRRAWGRAS